MAYPSLVEKALHRALTSYAGKVDRAGKPYILHPLRLMARLNDPIGQCVALLQAVIEDSRVTAADLHLDGFPETVINSVLTLTQIDGEGYDAFIERVRIDPLARKVKLLDLEDKMNLLRLTVVTDQDLKRVAKYHRAWMLLDSPES
jgi:(p)ppGpp synthase/HD superfamily hydrolase